MWTYGQLKAWLLVTQPSPLLTQKENVFVLWHLDTCLKHINPLFNPTLVYPGVIFTIFINAINLEPFLICYLIKLISTFDTYDP